MTFSLCMEASLGFKVGASGSQEVAVSASKPISLSGRSTGFDSTYVTPHSKSPAPGVSLTFGLGLGY